MPDTPDSDFEQDRDRLHIQMMSAVSHDLKTPLASIIGSLEIHNKMNDSLSEEKKLILIKTALEEAYRLDGFISNILDMARLENNMVKIHKRPYDLDQVVQDCLYKLGDWEKIADIKVVRPTEQITCEMDASLLTRSVQCLLDNALKHSGPGKPKLFIQYGYKDHQIFIDIKDNGPGIPLEDREQVFNKYTRLSKRDYKIAGTGLGLTIARAIIGLMGGEVIINNNEQDPDYKGAWFSIKLPCVKE